MDTKRIEKYTEHSYEQPNSSHTLIPMGKYYRIRIISMGTTITGSVQIIYHKTKSAKLTNFINTPINDSNDKTKKILANC